MKYSHHLRFSEFRNTFCTSEILITAHLTFVYRKTCFKREFSRFLDKNTNNHLICCEKNDKYIEQELQALNTYLWSF